MNAAAKGSLGGALVSVWRAEVEYRTRRVVYLVADSRPSAKQAAQDTTEWTDALQPHELTGPHDKIVVKSLRAER